MTVPDEFTEAARMTAPAVALPVVDPDPDVRTNIAALFVITFIYG